MYRFEAAAKLLLDGYDVLLHDADVFFQKDSIARFMDFVLHLNRPHLTMISLYRITVCGKTRTID